MIKKLFDFKILALVAVFSLLIGVLSGGWAMSKWSAVQEADRLKVALEIKAQERKAALAALKNYYENLPPVEVIKTEVEYVIKKIPYPVECDVSPREQRMLDYSRTGVRAASAGADASPGEPGAPAPLKRVPRAVEVRAHANAGIEHQKCYAAAKAVHLYLKNRAAPL